MGCPQCHSDEISPDGKCLSCGHQVTAENPPPKSESMERESSAYSSMIEMDYSAGVQQPMQKGELPQWRKDLSQRLHEIRQKKEATGADGILPEKKSPAFSTSQKLVAAPPVIQPPRFVEKTLVRKVAQMPRTPPPRQKTLQPVEQGSSASRPDVNKTDPHDVQQLIDNAVSRQSKTERVPAPDAEISSPVSRSFVDHEGKLILLSRTLSGLVDLICVVIFTGTFVIAADMFSGIIVLDAVSLMNIAALFLLTYFVYSIFFLGASGQTIGMMITDLRVIGEDGARPLLHQLLSRCCWHLVSFFGLGIGLLWSLFDRESLCLHDMLSETRVKRI
jgi:uncharacterized RDD family membrane protein YckC